MWPARVGFAATIKGRPPKRTAGRRSPLPRGERALAPFLTLAGANDVVVSRVRTQVREGSAVLPRTAADEGGAMSVDTAAFEPYVGRGRLVGRPPDGGRAAAGIDVWSADDVDGALERLLARHLATLGLRQHAAVALSLLLSTRAC